VPKCKGAPLPTMALGRGDEVDRDVAFEPPPTPFDPRLLLTGATAPSSSSGGGNGGGAGGAGGAPREEGLGATWTSGLFDRDSFRECMGGWAKSVVTGRARLGGIPIGVIVPELRTVTAVSPADPAAKESQESVTQQAGQVWFPDSAFKTSQAIRDFTGEDLPIMILANWRGFSGGQRDMFNEVLKFGSTIVDALVAATTPVFVYIPPRGELRGGAWVVVDPTINPAVMEMYCDPTGRGGVLEPSGIVAIKFRGEDLAAAAARMDPALAALQAAARAAAAGSEEAAAAKRAAAARAELVAGVVLQAAHAFADLHDTPGRMLAKGAISGVVPWRRARSFFYWRLRRRLAEGALARRLLEAAPQMAAPHAAALLRGWFLDALAGLGVRVERAGAGAAEQWANDVRVLQWLQDNAEDLNGRVAALRRESISETVLGLGLEDPTAVVNGVLALLSRLPLDRKEGALGVLRRGLVFGDAGASTGSPVPLPGRGWGPR
jgi:acetyl-CoA carboxylase/biotin carboxylase 1